MNIKERALIDKRFLALYNEQQSWVPGYRDIQRFINPTRGFFYEAIPNWGRAIDHKSQLTGAPNRAVRIMAAGMKSGMTSASRPWFKLGLEDQDLMEYPEAKEWLEVCKLRMMNVFAKSNVYGALHTMYEEVGTFGTGAMIVLEDFDSVIRCRTFTAGEYMIGFDENQRLNTFARQFAMTVGQLVKEFGEENVSPLVLSKWQNGDADSWIRVCHLIEPNNDRIPNKKDFMNMPFRSVIWEKVSPAEMALNISGYEEFPCMAPRWQTTTTSFSYRWGPGHYSLGDVKSPMQMKKDFLVALAKVNNPPVMVSGDIQGEANMLPNGVTRYSATTPNSGARPAYQIDPRLRDMQISMDKLEDEIGENFFRQLFQMLATSQEGQMTAFEVAKRYEEKLALLGPVIEHLEGELLTPLITRTFAIMNRAGLIPPPPEEIQGQNLKIEYVSMLAEAQKMSGTLAIEKTMAFAGNLMAADPGVKDIIDFGKAVEKYAEMEDITAKIIRTPEQVEMLRKQRAQQEANQAMMQNLGAVVQGAKTLSDTKVGQGSALDGLIGSK